MSDSGPSGYERVAVAKTYKLYVGGAFPRSESGRVHAVHDAQGTFRANVSQASRKDLRDAVAAARKAFGVWSSATGLNRGQVLYRLAEMLEGRAEQFAAEIAAAEGVDHTRALSDVHTAVDRVVWYAGWTDKFAGVHGTVNSIAGPYVSYTVPQPTGVVGILAPRQSSLLGLITVLAGPLATGNACVVVTDSRRSLPAVTLCEALATSDLPGGAVNLLTGDLDELAPWLASHADVDALDLTGAGEQSRADLERAASGTVKRVLAAPKQEPDWNYPPDTRRLRTFTDLKTVWHPEGD